MLLKVQVRLKKPLILQQEMDLRLSLKRALALSLKLISQLSQLRVILRRAKMVQNQQQIVKLSIAMKRQKERVKRMALDPYSQLHPKRMTLIRRKRSQLLALSPKPRK